MYRQAEGFVIRSKLTHTFKCQDGFRRIKCASSGGRIQIYAADDRTADGVIPSLALIDELHRHRNLRLYRTWAGKLDKRDVQWQRCKNKTCCIREGVEDGQPTDHAQLATISTAGEPGSEFENLRTHILKSSPMVEQNGEHGSHIRAATDTVVLNDWAVRDRTKIEDMEVVAEANPISKLTPPVLTRKRKRPTMTPEHWQRFTCNLATRLDESGVEEEEWDALKIPSVEEAKNASYIIGGLDLGWKVDCSALVILGWNAEDRRLIGAVRVIEPPVDEDELVETLLELDTEFNPKAWVYDPAAGGQQVAQQLENGKHHLQQGRKHRNITWVEHNQANVAMSLAASRFDEALRNGWLAHDGNLDLRQHVLNAVRHPIPGERYRFDRPREATGQRRREFPIDAFTALLMAHSVAVGEMQSNSSPMVMW